MAVEKAFLARKPRTRVAMTPRGRAAFAGHVAYLRGLLDGAILDAAD